MIDIAAPILVSWRRMLQSDDPIAREDRDSLVQMISDYEDVRMRVLRAIDVLREHGVAV